MIRVVITGPPTGTGFMPYVIDWWYRGRHHFVGLSPTPLLDACRQLQQFGLMNDTVVGLFNKGDDRWIERTTVGYGAKTMAPYREFPGGPIKEIPDPPGEPPGGRPRSEAVYPTDAPPAIQEEGPPPPHTPREHPNDTDREHSRPAKLEKSHHRQKRAKSAGHRGLGRGR